MSWATLTMFCVVGGTSYVSVTRLIDTHSWLEHSQVVMEKFEKLLYRVTESASTERGYILTGQEQYLEPYHQAVNETRKAMAELKDLVKDNPDQTARVSLLVPVIEERLSNFDEVIRTYKYPGPEAAIEMVRKGNGKLFMDVVRASVQDLINNEKILLKERDDQADHSEQYSLMTVIFGALLSMAVVFFYNFFSSEKISSNLTLLQKSIDNMLKDRFDSVPQLTTTDEFGEISKSVYQLGLKVQRNAEELQQERFLRIEAEAEREDKAARLRGLKGVIDSLLLSIRQLRTSIPDENPYSIDGAGPASVASMKEHSQDFDKLLKTEEDKAHQTIELCRNLDERLLSIQERTKNLETRTDAFINLNNEILTELNTIDHAAGGGAQSPEPIRKNSTSIRNLVNKITHLVIAIQSGCDETLLNAERGLRALRDATARLEESESSKGNQREAKERLVQTALDYVKVYQNSVERDRRLWNLYADISHHAQQVELISRHISKTIQYADDGSQPNEVADIDAMVPLSS